MRTIVIGCDNAAVHLKNELMDFMEKKGYTVENMGCDSTEDSTYYPYVAEKVCQEIIKQRLSEARCADLRHRIGHGHDCQQIQGHPRRRLP